MEEERPKHALLGFSPDAHPWEKLVICQLWWSSMVKESCHYFAFIKKKWNVHSRWTRFWSIRLSNGWFTVSPVYNLVSTHGSWAVHHGGSVEAVHHFTASTLPSSGVHRGRRGYAQNCKSNFDAYLQFLSMLLQLLVTR